MGRGPVKKRISIYEARKFNPFEATIQNVADFFFYLELTEEVTTAHQSACLTSLAKYVPHLGPQLNAGKNVSEGFKSLLLPLNPSFIYKEDHQEELQLLQSTLGFLGSGERTWEGFSDFCSRSQTDPFLASPILVASFIRRLLFHKPDKARDFRQLSRSFNFYSKNIEMICGWLDKIFNKNPLLQHPEVQKLMIASVAMENKALSNDLAVSLLPKHHYIASRLTIGEENFWRERFTLSVFNDVRKSVVSLPVAALELGVTSEMLFAAMTESKESHGEILPSLNEFSQRRGGSASKYWKDDRVVEMLEDVRNRRSSVPAAAFRLGVSRQQVLLRCGKIKSEEELEAERALEQIRKVNEKEEVERRNYTKATMLEKQIWYAEKEEEELCEYEQQRLSNLRERMAIMEELNFQEDKMEIRRQTKIISRSAPREKVVVARREKSERIQRRQEQQRLQTSSAKAPGGRGRVCPERLTPLWFGQTVPTNTREEQVAANNPVPKFDLLATQLLEITNDYRASRVFLDSLGEESQPEEEKLKPGVDWEKGVVVAGEAIVSTSLLTDLDTCGDLVSYGTSEGGVGILLEGRSVTLRPHNHPVTGISIRGSSEGPGGVGVISSSLDGTVRLYDLPSQKVGLEYSWDSRDTAPHQVLAMARSGEDTYLLDTGENILRVDIRNRKQTSLYKLEKVSVPVEKTSFDVHPTEPQLVSICRGERILILDLRKTATPLWTENIGACLEFAGWSQNTGKFYCSVTDRNREPDVFEFSRGVPGQVKRGYRYRDNIQHQTITGNIWCPWQENLLFSVNKSELHLVDAERYFCLIKPSFDDDIFSGKFLQNLKVGVKLANRPITLHSHRTRPLIVIGNNHSLGRIQLISVQL